MSDKIRSTTRNYFNISSNINLKIICFSSENLTNERRTHTKVKSFYEIDSDEFRRQLSEKVKTKLKVEERNISFGLRVFTGAVFPFFAEGDNAGFYFIPG